MVMLDNSRTDSTRIVSTRANSAEATTEAPIGLEWESVEGVQPAAWVGRVRGIFVGMVEARWQEGFTSTTRLGRKLGTFGTLADAQGAFVIHNRNANTSGRR